MTPFERRQPDPLCHAYPGEPFTGAFPCGARWTSSDPTGLRGNSLSENLAFVTCPPCRAWLMERGGRHVEPSGQTRFAL